MSQSPSTSQIELSQQVADAVQAGNLARAKQLLEQIGDAADPRILKAVAGVCINKHQWRETIAILQRLEDPDLGSQLKLRLARNLLLLQEKRPDVYETVVGNNPRSECDIQRLSTGQFTIVQTLPGQRSKSPSHSHDPRDDANQLLDSVSKVINKNEAILLAGIGDGYALDALPSQITEAIEGLRPTIYIVEPDPEVLLHVLMIHDYTQKDGPIECESYLWFVGVSWEEQFRHAMVNDLLLPDPSTVFRQSLRGAEVLDPINKIVKERSAPNTAFIKELNDYYETLDRETLVNLLSPHPPRPPRLLVLTSQFTTVLQYSARDVIDAFKELGWETRLVIEPKPYHRITHIGLRQILVDFKPDIFFQIDHLRYESSQLYHPNLPIVCWIQDKLPNLIHPAAGKSISTRDFVLGPNRPTYVQEHGYPQRQWIDMGKLSRVPKRPAKWDSDGDDLVYVSNASQRGEDLSDQLLNETAGGETGKRIVRACCKRLMQIYRDGQSVETSYQILTIVREVEEELNVTIRNDQNRGSLVTRLVHPLNDALYRQQGLIWAARIAERLGLTLSIYGKGWDQHPDLANYARGYVSYGSDLEDLTRRSKINLRLEPLPTLAHQRMTDGLISGGFFLSRRSIAEDRAQALANFLHEHADESVETVEQAMEAVPTKYHKELSELVTRTAQTIDTIHDPIMGTRLCQRIGMLAPHGRVLPRLDEISFQDEATLQACIERFINKPQQRVDIAQAQRQHVEQRMTYPTGMRRMIEQIRELIATETSATSVSTETLKKTA